MFEKIEGAERPELFKVILIDTEKDKPQIIKTSGGLDEWYKLIGCNHIDIQERYIDGHAYDFITDDEALYRGGAKVSALDTEGQPHIVGNIVICRCDQEGNETGLTDEDIERIYNHAIILELSQPVEGRAQRYIALNNIEY